MGLKSIPYSVVLSNYLRTQYNQTFHFWQGAHHFICIKTCYAMVFMVIHQTSGRGK